MYTGLIKKTGVLKIHKDKPILYKITEKKVLQCPLTNPKTFSNPAFFLNNSGGHFERIYKNGFI